MSFFNEINDVLIVETFKQISQRRDIEANIWPTGCNAGLNIFQQSVVALLHS